MADLQIIKPQNENEIIITPQAEDRLVLDFNPSDVLITRDDDNLIFSFEDNKSRIILEDFYVAYSSENMPEFEIQGALVPGVAFFEALSDELMPAAGPAASTPQGGGTIVGTETTSLLDAQVEGLEASEVDGFYGSATPLSGFPDFATAALADADAAAEALPLPAAALPVIDGDDSNNRLVGTPDSEIINGFGGNDRLFGRDGNDFLFGGDGDDSLDGGGDNDSLFGGLGNDTITGGAGIDILMGEEGNDFLQDSSQDSFSGGSGFDVIKIDLINITDVLQIDGGEDIDILLSSTASLSQMADEATNIELFVSGAGVDKLYGTTVAGMYTDLQNVGIDFDDVNDQFILDKADWKVTSTSQGTGLIEYTNANDDLTILINSTMVTTA